MATLELIQKPEILSIDNGILRIKHPDISKYTRTPLISTIAAAGTAMSVGDNNNFNDNDWFIVGEIGDPKTEEDDVNGAVTRGQSVTVTNTLKFAHEINDPVTKIFERGIKIYGAATDGGSGTLIASVDAITTPIADAVMIQWNQEYTEYGLITTDTTYNYYFVKFTDGTTDSSASDYVASTGLASNSAKKMIDNALDITGAEVDEDLSWKRLIRWAQDWQDYATQWIDSSTGVKKDWSWEFITNDTSLSLSEMEDEYALSGLTYAMKYPDTKSSCLNIMIGPYPTKYIPMDVFDRRRNGVIRTTVNTAISASATSIVLDNTYVLTETGTVTIGADTITYTANTETTKTLSGCTDVDNAHSVGAAVWQGQSGGRPYEWTIYNGKLRFFTPPSDTYAGYPIRCKYIKKLTALSEVTDTTEIPFYNTCQYFLAWKIELRRKNFEIANYYKGLLDTELTKNSRSDKSYTTETYEYYKFKDPLYRDNQTDWNSDVTY